MSLPDVELARYELTKTFPLQVHRKILMHWQSLFHDVSPAPLSSDKQCESLCRWFIFEENLNWPNFFGNWQASIEGIGKSIEFSRQIISFNTFYAIFFRSPGNFHDNKKLKLKSKGNNLNPLFDTQDLKSPVRNKTNIKTCTNAINRVELLWCNTSSKAPLSSWRWRVYSSYRRELNS